MLFDLELFGHLLGFLKTQALPRRMSKLHHAACLDNAKRVVQLPFPRGPTNWPRLSNTKSRGQVNLSVLPPPTRNRTLNIVDVAGGYDVLSDLCIPHNHPTRSRKVMHKANPWIAPSGEKRRHSKIRTLERYAFAAGNCRDIHSAAILMI